MRELYGYQKRAIQYIQSRPKAALFMEMRLGKSLCVIRGFAGSKKRILIVCPKSVIGTWQEELEKEKITDYRFFTSNELKHYRWTLKFRLCCWTIMNYEAVMKFSEDEINSNFDVVVLDESVRIKDPQTHVTRFFLQNFEKMNYKIILSGNPAPNTPLEYFSQFKFLFGQWMGCDNYWLFRGRYFGCDRMGWTWWLRPKNRNLLRYNLHKDAYVLTRKQVKVALPKVYEKRYVEMPPKVRKEYERMEKEFVMNLPNGEILETKYILPKLSYLQQIAGGHIQNYLMSDFKVKELLYLLKTELKKEKVIIWCWFKWEIEQIQRELKKENIMCGSIHGETGLDLHRKFIKNFQDGNMQVLCLQVSTGKYGLNLSSANTAIYFSNSLKPDDRNQSEFRIEHNEKKGPLLYIDLVTKNTVDEDVLKGLMLKRKNSQYFLNNVIDEIRKRNVHTKS